MNRDRVLLVCAVGITRFLFRSHLLYDIDSVNFALALGRFDPGVHQPHPPGYYLYVCLGRLFQVFTHDAATALVWVSIAASCGAVLMIYALTEEWFGRKAAIFAGALFVASPLAWFHGIVALVYIVEAFFSALVGYLCWRAYRGNAALAIPAAVALGTAAGFRPSSLLFLGPMWLLSMWRLPRKRLLWSAAALGGTIAAWAIPMLIESGGWRSYFGAFAALWNLVPGRRSVIESGIALAAARLVTAGAMYALCFGSGIVALWLRAEPLDKAGRLFAACWILPGALFFTLVFFNYVNGGYVLVLAPPAFAWLGARAAAWYNRSRLHGAFKTGLVSALAAVNAVFFLAAPVYCSHRGVREFEAALRGVRTAIARTFNAEDTLIVAFDSHFLGYRHAAYYLPEFLTVQYPAVRFPDGPKIFAVERRDTMLLREVPAGRFKSFVLFPLPQGREYRDYLRGVLEQLPGSLRAVRAESQVFLTGSTDQLQGLFPTAVYQQAHTGPQVSTAGDTRAAPEHRSMP